MLYSLTSDFQSLLDAQLLTPYITTTSIIYVDRDRWFYGVSSVFEIKK